MKLPKGWSMDRSCRLVDSSELLGGTIIELPDETSTWVSPTHHCGICGVRIVYHDGVAFCDCCGQKHVNYWPNPPLSFRKFLRLCKFQKTPTAPLDDALGKFGLAEYRDLLDNPYLGLTIRQKNRDDKCGHCKSQIAECGAQATL
jgi:hypothetical protein